MVGINLLSTIIAVLAYKNVATILTVRLKLFH